MSREFLMENLAKWEEEKSKTLHQIREYEKGNHSTIRDLVYERGDYHKALKMEETKIREIKLKLAAC